MQIVSLNPLPGSRAKLVGYLHEPADEFLPRNARPCALIFPGGAYRRLAGHEAEPIAVEFYRAGYQAFVLSYSVADRVGSEGLPLGLTPLREASDAVMTIREHAAAWRVLPDSIAVCGFSAGGHLAGSIGSLWNSRRLTEELDTKGGANRPDAVVLCYPVLTMGEFTHQESMKNLVGVDGDRDFFSLEQQVGPHTPPTFLWHTVEDAGVPVENSLQMAGALRRAGIPFECHLYAKGPHGLGLANGENGRENPHCATWMPLCLEWLNDQFSWRM